MTQPATPHNMTIALGGVHANLTCYGFHIWAEDFLEASKAYVAIARKGSLVAHFLCCQSFELSLKAFLSLKGASRRTLARKPFGHNLDRLVDESNRHPLSRAARSNDCARLKTAVALKHHALAGIITLISIIGAGIRVGRGRVI
jgi:HEPN domain-containing protein